MEKTTATTSNRLISLDVFRGITIAAMILVNFPGSWKVGYEPLEHAPWEGSTPADYIFPFFIFIVGISITLSFTKLLKEGQPKGQIFKKILWRTLKIFAIGVALKILPTFDFSRIELPGVLQRIPCANRHPASPPHGKRPCAKARPMWKPPIPALRNSFAACSRDWATPRRRAPR